jgi:hypothetical protein
MQKPQKLILLGALFVLLFVYVGVLTYFTFSAVLTSGFPGWFATKDGRVTHFESNNPASVLQNGDEIVLLEGSPYRGISQYFELMTNRPPGQSYEITNSKTPVSFACNEAFTSEFVDQ